MEDTWTRPELAEALRTGDRQSAHPDWHPQNARDLLAEVAQGRLSASQLAALAAARRADEALAEALRTMDRALLALAATLEAPQL